MKKMMTFNQRMMRRMSSIRARIDGLIAINNNQALAAPPSRPPAVVVATMVFL
jgi:hypothetical protein